MNKNTKIILAVIVSVAVAVGVWYGIQRRQKNQAENTSVPSGANIPVANLPSRNLGQMAKMPDEPTTTVTSFANLPKELQKKELSINLQADAGFIILTSVLSNSKDKIVYAEISDYIYWLNDYRGDSKYDSESWQYGVYVKDLKTDQVKKVFAYNSKELFPLSIKSLFIKTARAGGCAVVPFPLAWSKNDKKIIFQWGNPTDCGSGGSPKYLTYVMDADGGKLEGLATYGNIFFDNYAYVVYGDQSLKSPQVCGLGPEINMGKITYQEIETGQKITLIEQPNSFYEITDFDQHSRMLKYKVWKTIRAPGEVCASSDLQSVKESEVLVPGFAN